jgi:selenide,water dikinase
MNDKMEIRLTDYTKGGGCGCKIPPAELSEILRGQKTSNEFGLLVGNSAGDDAAVVELGDAYCLISTTDFFTPIVDDPFDFGRIAAANSISDIYAMGGKPILALSILAWPTEKLPAAIAAEVLRGARAVCAEAGIAIGGGHSIENPEPVFGLAVNGIIERSKIKRNNTVQEGDVLILTKPLGSGVLSTAMKRNLLTNEQVAYLVEQLVLLNHIGAQLSAFEEVHAMTDVTGFGLIGHLLEMVNRSGLTAKIDYAAVPLLDGVQELTDQFVYADNTMRNWKAYNTQVSGVAGGSLLTLCDPQTNGGLLLAVSSTELKTIEAFLKAEGQFYSVIGSITAHQGFSIVIE